MRPAYSLYDTAYYFSYERRLTTRFFFSQKFTSLTIKDQASKYNLTYSPNTTLNMGIGATYKSFTLNLAYGFGFLNPDVGKGKTRYLDLQFHNYGRKVVLDVLGQFYSGFYTSLNGTGPPSDRYYLRPDLRVNEIGVSAQYVLNNRKFSYRASFLQDEWQKKSSGTILVGFEAYGGWVRADSAIVPTAIGGEASFNNPRKFNFFEFGPNVGYAHTLIIKKHFFFTASGSVSLDYGVSTLTNNERTHQSVGFSPNTFLRFFCGYNSSRWAISAVYVRNSVRLASDNAPQIILNTGNIRLNYVHRFRLGRKGRKALKVVDDAEKAIGASP